MIVYFDKNTGRIYGCSEGYEVKKEVTIHPDSVSPDDVDKMVLDKKFEKRNTDLIADISGYKVTSKRAKKFVKRPPKPVRKRKKKEDKVPCHVIIKKLRDKVEELQDEIAQLKGRSSGRIK